MTLAMASQVWWGTWYGGTAHDHQGLQKPLPVLSYQWCSSVSAHFLPT